MGDAFSLEATDELEENIALSHPRVAVDKYNAFSADEVTELVGFGSFDQAAGDQRAFS
jgi:hypothetical protein